MENREKIRIGRALIEAGEKLIREAEADSLAKAIKRLSEIAPRHWI